MKNRKGDWLQTFSGIAFYPMDPRPDEIIITDIAHALSMKCRYAGHTEKFYSVAEHSILVSRYVPVEHALWGLMHDAAEAYSSDIPSPIKKYLIEWKSIETNIMNAVCDRFGMNRNEPAEVKKIDFAILTDEKKLVMGNFNIEWPYINKELLGADIKCYSSKIAKWTFLERFKEINAASSNSNK